MKNTIIKGTIEPYKTVQAVILTARGTTVTYTIVDGIVRISDMWR